MASTVPGPTAERGAAEEPGAWEQVALEAGHAVEPPENRSVAAVAAVVVVAAAEGLADKQPGTAAERPQGSIARRAEGRFGAVAVGRLAKAEAGNSAEVEPC